MNDTAEQQAREILDRLSIDDALSMTAGDVVEIANLIRDRDRLARDVLVLTKALVQIQRISTAAVHDPVYRASLLSAQEYEA